ncbi:MAG TPA: lipoyl(octanoyl) transferase LipB [Polyangiaceae bacterium]|nr:lipoyl(octanoyl) transferase LipB [Polyangiaceae bacterium]
MTGSLDGTPARWRPLWLGQQEYELVHELQEQLFEARKEQLIADTVLFVEHPAVITLGRGARAEHVLLDETSRRAAGIALAATGRGGDVTLHAPGQLVCYPILELPEGRRDVRRYVRDLCECMRRVAAEYGVSGGTLSDYVGLWVDADSPGDWPGEEAAVTPVKIGAIGVRLSRWVTMHGFALNLTTDLSLFRSIVPCGIQQHGVGSVQTLSGVAPSVRSAAELAVHHLGRIFDLPPSNLEDARLDRVRGELLRTEPTAHPSP